MTDTEIRVTIAEACGWTLEKTNVHDGKCWHLNGIQSEISPPDYHNDLNAMHEAERIIDQMPIDGKSLWYDYLALEVGWDGEKNAADARFAANYNSARATARQRAEAFLRTIGRWKENTRKPEEEKPTPDATSQT